MAVDQEPFLDILTVGENFRSFDNVKGPEYAIPRVKRPYTLTQRTVQIEPGSS